MKQYRLLRDNKETGPYAAEELIQMGLKKYDLVWVEGRSAAWRYPCEIEAFKPYVPPVEEQPFDRFYKKPSASSAQQPTPTVTTTETPVLAATVVKKEKPRFRVKADSHKIETIVTTVVNPAFQPGPIIQPQSFSYTQHNAEPEPVKQSQPVSYNTYTEPVKQSQPVQTNNNPAWENMWLDWEQEKKAVSNASVSYQTVNDRIKHIGEEELLETKFSQSLDDIAGQYADSLLARKKSAGGFEKYKSHLTAAVLLIAILAAGMWVGLKWSDKTGYIEAKNNQPQQDIQLIPNETAPNENTTENTEAVVDNAPKQEENVEVSQPVKNKKQSIVTPAVARNTKPAVIASQRNNVVSATNTVAKTQKINTVAKTAVQTVAPVQKNYQPSVTEANGARSSVKRNEIENTAKEPATQQPVANNEVKRQVKKAASIDDYVDVESYPVSSGVQYNLSNISDVSLDLVVLDLQYFDATGKYLKGETLTVKNIEAGGSIKVNAPQNAKAAGIKYKVSMISSAQNDLNIIAD
ncbi:DUF4339 domain-containing protein [Panacibacter ginsenosidivorans]|uniref:DUF4339 domain-containing protein n=1 Tax=Panacibacter ginsenosidivorans TaxID=1813871 RepID=A0A5B8V415_9BACT|nr:DUF4339 domain-containing protein [Panacibacter ginsenosidivorans]QEC65918.1 DUF4339 domain-containing protein [Panacibacter ginsenosidivorans]